MTSADSEQDLGDSTRQDFPVLQRKIDGKPIVYLDSAATSLKPQSVIDEVVRYYAEIGANIHRGKHYLSEEASNDFERARYKIAQHVGAMGNEIVLVRNTTEAINMVAMGLGLSMDDRVVVCMDGHHSQLLPWRAVAQTDMIRVDDNGAVDLNHYEDLLKNNPKVVVISHCSNVTGLYAPLEKMVKMAKGAGALVMVDAAQSIPHRRIKVTDLDVDFLAFSAHKMLGPTGIGALYGKYDLLCELDPVYLGGGTVDWVDLEGHRLRKVPHRFEAGTPHIAGVLGFAAAVDYLQLIGLDEIERHDVELGKLMLSEALKRDYMSVLAPSYDGERAALVSLRFPKAENLGDIARYLSDSYGIMCRTGHLCAQPLVDKLASGQVLRASAYLYNTKDEIRQLFTALDRLRERLDL